MITNLIKSGFGHSVRFIAMVENLRKYTDEQISYLAPDCMQEFINSNVSKYNCTAYNLYYYLSLVDQKARKISDKRISHKFKTTSVMIDDFFLYTKLRKLFSNRTIRCGLYHGDINISNNDSAETISFKKNVLKKANQHDIFFHINFEQPQKKPKMKCIYVPIPIVSRQVSISKQTVNKLLGLRPDDKFILIHAGAAVSTNVYMDLYNFYKAINNLKTDYKIVIARSIENHQFPFHSGIIRAPLFTNGIDLVNASELVVSKPGMGILQDCTVTKKPLLFVPADSVERKIKIELLDKLLSSNLPTLKKIDASSLKTCIKECLSIRDIYTQAYEKVPTNGADILARSINFLSHSTKDTLEDFIPVIKKMSPFC